MKVLVAIKRVVDYNARVRIKPDQVRLQHGARYVSTPTHPPSSDWRGSRSSQDEHEPVLRDRSRGTQAVRHCPTSHHTQLGGAAPQGSQGRHRGAGRVSWPQARTGVF